MSKGLKTILCSDEAITKLNKGTYQFVIDMGKYKDALYDNEQIFDGELNHIIEGLIYKCAYTKEHLLEKFHIKSESNKECFMTVKLAPINEHVIKVIYEINNVHLKDRINNCLYSREVYKNILSTVKFPLIVVDKNNQIILLNHTAEVMLCNKIESVIGRNVKEILETVLNFRKLDYIYNNINNQHYFYMYTSKNGKQRLAFYHESHIDNNIGSHERKVIAIYDVTEDFEHTKKINNLFKIDKLTGVYSRGYFDERLKIVDDKSNLPISAMVIDINGLKILNDVFGHDVGDRLLKHAGKILTTSCSEYSKKAIIGRTGGDEFVIILPNTRNDEANKIKNNIMEKCIIDYGLPIKVSMSIGLETKSYSWEELKQKLKSAEEKMYKEKILKSKQIKTNIINSLKKTLEDKTHETTAHGNRIKGYAEMVGTSLNLSELELKQLELFATIHDIGKIRIPRRILEKKDMLTIDDWELIKSHAEAGYRIALSIPEFASVAELILCHHEHWDGSGYPQGLKGNDIPLLSRILSVVDAYDAMTHKRPYQKVMTNQEAIKELKECAGKQFDEKIVDNFIEVIESKGTINK